jgi:hypothetical protein
MKKEIKDGQGFICKDLDEKIRIWEKLIQHRYPIFADGNDPCYKHIVWEDGEFVETNQNNIQPLHEAEFFGETKWTPENKEMTHEQKLQYMNLAGGIVGFRFADKDLDMLVTTYDLIIKKKDETDIADLCKVRADVNDRHKIIEP